MHQPSHEKGFEMRRVNQLAAVDDIGTVHADRMGQQQAGLQCGTVDPGSSEPRGGAAQGLADGDHSSAARRAAWSSAVSASMNSSSSPIITRSIL
jgi:hypothetical protein